jgi:hypothetical protein
LLTSKRCKRKSVFGQPIGRQFCSLRKRNVSLTSLEILPAQHLL